MKIINTIIIVLLLIGYISFSNAESGEFDLTNSQVDVNDFMSGGPKKDGIPALTDPSFVSAEKANFLKSTDMIVGISIDGQAKAYPIKILNWHEVVNDKLSDVSYAVTWCPLTKSAVTFDREVQGQTLEFGVSGLLYNSNVVMYDRNHDGLWSQMKMGGLTGELSAENLDLLPSELTTWDAWHQAHPDTLVLSRKTGYFRKYNTDPYGSYHNSSQTMFPLSKNDNRLPLKSLVIGIKIGDIAKAYPLNKIQEPIEDKIAGVNIIVYSGENQSAVIKDKDGNVLPSVVAYWFAWSTFNQNTLVYQN